MTYLHAGRQECLQLPNCGVSPQAAALARQQQRVRPRAPYGPAAQPQYAAPPPPLAPLPAHSEPEPDAQPQHSASADSGAPAPLASVDARSDGAGAPPPSPAASDPLAPALAAFQPLLNLDYEQGDQPLSEHDYENDVLDVEVPLQPQELDAADLAPDPADVQLQVPPNVAAAMPPKCPGPMPAEAPRPQYSYPQHPATMGTSRNRAAAYRERLDAPLHDTSPLSMRQLVCSAAINAIGAPQSCVNGFLNTMSSMLHAPNLVPPTYHIVSVVASCSPGAACRVCRACFKHT